ncbi:hypothetical protein GUITHDRAFT_116259 [Guillardia theta CCMP2712]|uniref:ACT domain-containing protein n=1 Tax=Guillardia theta (strain CCMP2712) TaxID=905079 RepID=L1INE8_GUITC|nr:hypothetical protein GUITHDRAFT_116259 [Guillardia theta CCMP2712]EKX37622.1 hypothetical protein GUITHDRAFT_116259 [Guillardia theta CCMP2712]|eukprot:XP_005824602.1 hypothetical protein GUITHDRAFT_116259 [Guillardia theta CCMP2712]
MLFYFTDMAWSFALSGMGGMKPLPCRLGTERARTCSIDGQRGKRGGQRKLSRTSLCKGNGEENTDDAARSLEGMSLEEIEALPELGELSCGDRPPMIEEIMQEDVRFEYKMRALRGEFSPSVGEDTEDSLHLAEALLKFPGPCELRVVVRNEGEVAQELSGMLASVEGLKVVSKTQEPRMGGKFLAVQFQVEVESALVRQRAFKVLEQDKRVKMKF